jgi:biotin transporter BioY
MTRQARAAVTVALVGAAGEVALASLTVPAWSSGQSPVLPLAFVAGPLVFLAVLVWRRRHRSTDLARSFWLALIVAVGGLIAFGWDYLRFRTEPASDRIDFIPFIVPLVQWAVVAAAWVVLVIAEGRAKKNDQ